jgi:hypothetical protein
MYVEYRLMALNDLIIDEIEKAYGKVLNKIERAYITQERGIGHLRSSLVSDCQAGLETSQNVASMLRELFGSTRIPTKTVYGEFNRSAITSKMMFLEAENIVQVQEFRKEVLNNNLLPQDMVMGWIKKTGKKDGIPTRWIDRVPLPDDINVELVEGNFKLTNELNVQRTKRLRGYELHYWVGDVRSTYITSGGTLDKVRMLSIELSQRYGWSQAQATTFVLTGTQFMVEAIEVEASIHPSILANKVVLKVDPTSTPKEVVEAFQWAKNQFFEPTSKQNKTKSEILAWFFVSHKGMNRNDRLRLWNKLCNQNESWKSSWTYDLVRGIDNFHRDLKTSYKKYLDGRKVKDGGY